MSNTSTVMAIIAIIATIGAISLSLLVTTPIYAEKPEEQYCYARESAITGRPIYSCVVGPGAEELCEQQQAADPEATSPCHRMVFPPRR